MTTKGTLISYLKAQIAEIDKKLDKLSAELHANPGLELIELRRNAQQELKDNPTLFSQKVTNYAKKENRLLARISQPNDIIAWNRELMACHTIRGFLYTELYKLENF
jgi:DNA repair exonuclease SbcCD ATPase subunit